MEALEQYLKPIREDNRQQHLSQFSPPRELTISSRASSANRISTNMIMLASSNKGPMQHASKVQATKPLANGEKRSRQVFEGARPSQVYIPQQTESDEIEDEDNVDMTPNSPDEEESLHIQKQVTVNSLDLVSSEKGDQVQSSAPALRSHLQIINQQQQEGELSSIQQKPNQQERLSLRGVTSLQGNSQRIMTGPNNFTPSDRSIGDEALKPSARQKQIQIPSPDQQNQPQYSPTVKSEKSPLGFTQNDQRSQSYSQMETMKSMDRSQMIGDEYCLLKDLGEGTFGNVKLGKHLSSGQLVAVKILEKKRITDQADVERVIREIKILKSIRHAHIIKLYEIIETKARIFLIMEYACGGELFDYIVRKDRLSEKEACRFYNQIVAGIEFLHSKGIAHRDLKPENLLLDKQKNLKIVDFGLSNTYKEGQTLKTACGSPCYAAPEMIAGKRYNGIEVDIWSSGVTLYAMLCGFLPFEDPDTALLYKKILKGDFELPDFLTNRSIKFLKEILCTDPSKRLVLDEIKQHAWLTQFDLKTSQHLDRTGDNSRMMLSTAEENKNFNTQIYGAKGNSSLIGELQQQNAANNTKDTHRNTQITIKPQKYHHPSTAQNRNNQYFAQVVNQSTFSSLTATVIKPSNNHQKSISATVGDQSITNMQGSISIQQNNRPSTSMKKNTTSAKAAKSHNAAGSSTGKRPKQQTTLSAIIGSPKNGSGANTHGICNSLKARPDEQFNTHQMKSERKTTANQNLKDKLRTLKNGRIDTILTQQQKQVVTATTTNKVRTQKVPTAISLLNNTMPMPMLKIDLASPSTGGSTDVGVYATNTGGIAQKDIFKNNLARVAKNSAAAAQLHIQQQTLRQKSSGTASNQTTVTGPKKQQNLSLKKQMLNQHLNGQLMAQHFIAQSRSVVGGGASAHSSLSNKRKKSPRGISHNSSSTIPTQNISQSASKAKAFPTKPVSNAFKTLSFETNGKTRGGRTNGGRQTNTASATLSSVHPYTIMAMPFNSISQNNLKETVLTQMGGSQSSAIITKKQSTNRHSLGSVLDPAIGLSKMPKAFVKSVQTLQTSQIRTSHMMQQNTRGQLQRHQTQKIQACSSIESQLRNVKIAFNSKKAPNFTGEYNNTVYSKVVAREAQKQQINNFQSQIQQQSRQAQSMEALKKGTRNASCDAIMLQPMRVCAQSAIAPEWCTTETPQQIIETLEALLPLLNVQFVHRKSPYLYSLKIARHASSQINGIQNITARSQSVKCELELMLLKNAPFVTVVRLTQKVKLKQSTTATSTIIMETENEKEGRLAQFIEFCRQLKQGLSLG